MQRPLRMAVLGNSDRCPPDPAQVTTGPLPASWSERVLSPLDKLLLAYFSAAVRGAHSAARVFERSIQVRQ